MSYSYSLSTNRGKVRLLIKDTSNEKFPVEGEDYIFSDAEIDAFLDMNGDAVWTAAADACRSLAADEVAGSLRLKLSGFEIDRSKVHDYWMKLADNYEKKAGNQAVEFIDSFDYRVSQSGEDETEYTGSLV